MFEPHIRMLDSAAGAAVGMYTAAADVAAQLMQQGATEGRQAGGELGSIIGGAMGWAIGGMVGAYAGFGHGAVVGGGHYTRERTHRHQAESHPPIPDPVVPPTVKPKP